jgi:hypothetical protein
MTITRTENTSLRKDVETTGVDSHALPGAEPLLRFARPPNAVEVCVDDPSALFETGPSATYPHSGPVLSKGLSSFLIDSARERRSRARVPVTITFRSPPLGAEKEDSIRARMSSYFTNEIELVELERRVNRSEGWGSLGFAIPFVILAGIGAGLLYASVGSAGTVSFGELAYATFVIIIWVMLWDPIEKLLFDPYFLRLRIHALRKLATAEVTFAYIPPSPAAPTPGSV